MRNNPTRAVRTLITGLLLLAGLASSAEALRRMGAGSIPPNGTRTHSLHIGMRDHWVTVEGQGRASDDLDCWIYDEYDDLIDSDTDYTDYCILRTPGLGRHRLVIRNYGAYTNRYEVYERESLD